MPEFLYISRLSEALHCRPSEALQEWLSTPAGWLDGVLEARLFDETKHVMDTKPPTEWPATEMVERIKAIDLALAHEDEDEGE